MPNESKSAGQIAYDRYCAMVNWTGWNGDELPQWPEVEERIRLAWESAAAAVISDFR